MRVRDLIEDLNGVHDVVLFEGTPEEIFKLETEKFEPLNESDLKFICHTNTKSVGIRPYLERKILKWNAYDALNGLYARLKIVLQEEGEEDE